MSETGPVAGRSHSEQRHIIDLLPPQVAVLTDEADLLLHYMGSFLAMVFDGCATGGSEGDSAQGMPEGSR